MRLSLESSSHDLLHLLRENYVPNHLELQTILPALTGIVEVGPSHSVTSDTNNIQLLKGLLAPIRRLPIEILGRIFVHCIEGDAFESTFPEFDNDISWDTAPLLFFRVCHTWHEVALKTPQLYTNITLENDLTVDPLKVIPIWLKRSGSLSLNISLKPEVWSISYDDTQRVMRQITHQFHRIKALKLSATTYIQLFFPAGSSTNAPLLTDLRLTSNLSEDELALEEQTGGELFAANLQHFESHTPWGWQRFVHFGQNLTHYEDAQTPLKATDVLWLLKQCPSLESFQFSYAEEILEDDNDEADTDSEDEDETGVEDDDEVFGIPDELQVQKPMLLANMKDFRVIWRGNVWLLKKLFTLLRTPRLDTLVLGDLRGITKGILNSILQWLASGNNLRLLLLNGIKVSPNALRSILHEIPSLQELYLRSIIINPRTLEILNRVKEPDLAPNLTSLDFHRADLTKAELWEVIQSRTMRQVFDNTFEHEHDTDVSERRCSGNKAQAILRVVRMTCTAQRDVDTEGTGEEILKQSNCPEVKIVQDQVAIGNTHRFLVYGISRRKLGRKKGFYI
ncbi:hypothetical protein M422DRAFT_64614 [Sphaerobolus stellatus SS14]|nr:hypothetical protein M422DRAFT_64614 [Sphaerobolus stellatus SS14]